MSPKILIMGTVYWAHQELKELFDGIAEIVTMDSSSREELFKDFAPGGRYSDIVAIFHEFESYKKVGYPDKAMIEALPPSCKWIGHKGAGYDEVDVATCKLRGIGVSNTPGAVDNGTATTALYLLISAMRQFAVCEASVRAGGWKPKHVEGASHDLEGRTVGILGFGNIGKRFAELLQPFQMKIVYHNRSKSKDAPEYCEYYPNLEEMLKVVDVLSVHIPLNAKTTGIIGEKEIRMMKPGSIIINTARGAVIDEDALISALQDGHLGGAGLDVFATEPKVNPRFLSLQNATLLPHVGTENQDSRRRMEVRAFTNMRDFLVSGRGADLVPECQ